MIMAMRFCWIEHHGSSISQVSGVMEMGSVIADDMMIIL
jgi:hypothetical protein